jgi:hypothetical protein
VQPEILTGLIAIIRTALHQDLRACYPRDLVNQICWAAKYDGKPPVIDRESVIRAVETYFVPDS